PSAGSGENKARARQMAGLAREPASSARCRESALAGDVRTRYRGHLRGFRNTGRAAVAPRAARLSRRRFSRAWLEHETHAAADCAVSHLSAVVEREARSGIEGPGQHSAGSPVAPPSDGG